MTGFELGSFGKGGDRAVNCGCLTISSNVKLEHFYGLESYSISKKSDLRQHCSGKCVTLLILGCAFISCLS